MQLEYPQTVLEEPVSPEAKDYPKLPGHPMKIDEFTYVEWLAAVTMAGLHQVALDSLFLNLSKVKGLSVISKDRLLCKISLCLRDWNGISRLFDSLNNSREGLNSSDLSLKLLLTIFTRLVAILKKG